MSFYATLSGMVTYDDPDAFNTVIKDLTDNTYLDSDGHWLDECGNRLTEHPNVDFDLQTILIPLAHYRNLSRYDFFHPREGGTDGAGWLVGTSTDGCFNGWINENGDETYYFDLAIWAAEHLDVKAPAIPDHMSSDDAWVAYLDWQPYVEHAFHDKYSYN